MYRNVIDIRREVPKDVLKRLVAIADKAFNNRAGKVKNVSTSPYRFIYEGGESEYGCLEDVYKRQAQKSIIEKNQY